ncbi:MAG: hypothetical protein ABL967_03780 [Bryobacteraceae bacterium]
MRACQTGRLPRVALAAIALFSSIPAFAEMDFSGDWAPRFHEDQPERVPGPNVGDYLGLPINAAARMRANTWDASLLELPQWQCRPHGGDYIWRGPSAPRIWKEVDPVSRKLVAWHIEYLRSIDRPIYMDGRPHPSPNAPHTWSGFATGKYEGDVMTTDVTHLKESYMRRNGIARSEKATFREHWIRHGDWLTVVTIVNDPVYLAEPFVRSTDYELDNHQHVPPYPCEVVTETDLRRVPHHLPGTNTFLHEVSDEFNIPYEATQGGPETMYPEYRIKLKGMSVGAKK